MIRQLATCAAVGIGAVVLWFVGGWGVGTLIPCEMEGFGCLGTLLTTLVLAVPVTILVSWIALRLLKVRGPAAVALLGPVLTVAIYFGADWLRLWELARLSPVSEVSQLVPAYVAGVGYLLVGWVTFEVTARRDAARGTRFRSPDPGP
ncbi:hypothetical protein AB0M43_20430 [Longispora sp. NPDC051575]|uniref:hypothetical protein n=1 Tax=Longispora sp. NPDC051575 TaxID=3154943 RepID=UPI00343FB8B4